MHLLIGAPYLHRDWIIDRYLEAASLSAEAAGVDSYSFLLMGADDDPTSALIDKAAENLSIKRVVLDDEKRNRDVRDWVTPGRLSRMVDLRNHLLVQVRAEAPDLFLSLDTDILLAPATIGNLIETMWSHHFDAVGGYTFLSSSTAAPTYGNMPTPNFIHRPNIAGTIQPCQIIMAIKLMNPAAYGVHYGHNRHGEDVAWSLACRKAGLRLGVDARVTNKHVMERGRLDLVDKRCGF